MYVKVYFEMSRTSPGNVLFGCLDVCASGFPGIMGIGATKLCDCWNVSECKTGPQL